MDRRQLLKLFGSGAVIAPVVQPDAVARIIEPPKVELISRPVVIAQHVKMKDAEEVTVTLKMRDGSAHSFTGECDQYCSGAVYTGDPMGITVWLGGFTSPATSDGRISARA